jgi:hypothetical protein
MLDRPSFILRVNFNVKRGSNVIHVRIVFLLSQLFFKSDSFGLKCGEVCPSFLKLYAFTCYLFKNKIKQ